MKLKKLLALALAGVLMLALLTGCSGGGNGEDRLVAEAVADIFKRIYPNTEVSYGVPALTRTIRPCRPPHPCRGRRLSPAVQVRARVL